MLKRFLYDESGATAVEYGIIAALLSITIIAGAALVGDSLDNKMDSVGTQVSAAGVSYLNN